MCSKNSKHNQVLIFTYLINTYKSLIKTNTNFINKYAGVNRAKLSFDVQADLCQAEKSLAEHTAAKCRQEVLFKNYLKTNRL